MNRIQRGRGGWAVEVGGLTRAAGIALLVMGLAIGGCSSKQKKPGEGGVGGPGGEIGQGGIGGAGGSSLKGLQNGTMGVNGPLGDIHLDPPPTLPAPAVRGVTLVLRYRGPSCLERSLILQRWLAAHGERRDVVIGITGATDFRAHAWLDGDPEAPAVPFQELARLRP